MHVGKATAGRWPVALAQAGVWGYGLLVRLAALLGNGKARLWLQGRRAQATALANWQPAGKTLWMHCSSLGEFEQGRPVLEAWRAAHPAWRVVLTFFSPSGYEVRKHYPQADLVLYLPEATTAPAKRFLAQINPALVVFVKYDVWPAYLLELNRRAIPAVLISARYDRLGWLQRAYQRAVLSRLTQVFVQDETSAAVVRNQLGVQAVTVAGDTRFDRVAHVAAGWQPIPEIEAFVAGRTCLVAGSTWPQDEALLLPLFAQSGNTCLILVPHELHASHLAQLASLPGAVRLSQLGAGEGHLTHPHILIVDQIGLLSRIYHYATAVWIGGGFGAGIHNTLEAAVYGKPLAFGPKYQRFREAVDLVQLGVATVIANHSEAAGWWQRMQHDPALVRVAANTAAQYVQRNTGATERIIQQLTFIS